MINLMVAAMINLLVVAGMVFVTHGELIQLLYNF